MKKLSQVENVVNGFIERLVAKTETEGVVLLGALGNNGHFDEYSDVDVGLFVGLTNHTNELPDWLPSFEFDFKLIKGRNIRENLQFNVHQHILSEEWSTAWDEPKKEAFSLGKLVYDKRGDLQRLLQSKLVYDEPERMRRLIELIAHFPPYAEINPRRQSKRGLIAVGHHILNECGEMVIESLFRFNRRFLPSKKWRLEKSFLLPWTPQGYKSQMKQAMLVKAYTGKDIERRITVFKKITTAISLHVARDSDFPTNPYDYVCKHIWHRQLLSTPFSESLIQKLRLIDISSEALELLIGLLNFNLVSSESELLSLLKEDRYVKTVLRRAELIQLQNALREYDP